MQEEKIEILKKIIASQREKLEKLENDNECLSKALNSCSQSIDSIVAAITTKYGEKIDTGYKISFEKAQVVDALKKYTLETSENEGVITIEVAERDSD